VGDGSLEGLLDQRNILEVGFERERRAEQAPRKSASGEDLGNRPKTAVVIECHWPENKAARQVLRLRMGPAGAIRTAELVARFSARSDLGPSLWFTLDEPKAALGHREAEGKSTGRELLTVGAVACKPKPGLFLNLVADAATAAAANQNFHRLIPPQLLDSGELGDRAQPIKGLFGRNGCAQNAQMENVKFAEHLAVFVEVCRLGSFSAAARRRAVTHSSIVRQIDALEAELGVPLLTRSTRALVPTSAGQLVLQRARPVLDDLVDLRAEVLALTGTVSGVLRIASLPTFGRRYVVRALEALMSEHPELNAELDLTERIADPVTERLDVVIRAGQLADSSLIATKLAPNEMRLVASPHYLDKFGRPNSIPELVGHRLLDKMHGSDQLGWSRVLGSANQRLAGVRHVFQCDDFGALREAALTGLGIALLPSWVVGQEIAAGSLRRVLPTVADASGDAGGVYVLRALADAPAKVTAFIASLRNVIGSPPIWDDEAKSY
jgi:DNA-binding transcriptional LysR family regulator